MHSRKLGIILSYVNTFINMLSGLFLSVFLLRQLGDAEYGVYQAISSFANYLVLFEFGTGTVMTRNISLCRSKGKEQSIRNNISTIWCITLFLTLIILIVSYGFYGSIDYIYQRSMTVEQLTNAKNIFVFVTIFLVMSFFKQTLLGIVMAYEKYALHSITSIFRNVLRIITLVALVIHIPTGLCIAVVDMIISLIIFFALYIYCKKVLRVSFSIRHFDKMVLKSSLPLCLAFFVQSIVNQTNNNVDKFIIGVTLKPEMVSIYSISLFVFSVFSSLSTIPITMYGPQVIAAVGKNAERRELADIMIPPGRLIVLVGGSILFGFIAAGRQFVEIAYGKGYTEAWLIAIILMFPKLFSMATEVVGNVLDAENKLVVRSTVLVIVTVLNIVLTVWWIELWGIIGAAIATAVSIILGLVIIMNIYYSVALKIPVLYMLRKIFKGVLVWHILAAVLAYISGSMVANVYISFAVSICVYVLVFGTTFMLFGATGDERMLVKKIIKRS